MIKSFSSLDEPTTTEASIDEISGGRHAEAHAFPWYLLLFSSIWSTPPASCFIHFINTVRCPEIHPSHLYLAPHFYLHLRWPFYSSPLNIHHFIYSNFAKVEMGFWKKICLPPQDCTNVQTRQGNAMLLRRDYHHQQACSYCLSLCGPRKNLCQTRLFKWWHIFFFWLP